MSKREKIMEEVEKKTTTGGGCCCDDKMEAALKNDLILETIFNLLLWKELNVVRQVCKDWYRLSLPIWRKKAPTLRLLVSKRDSRPPYPPMISQFLTAIMRGNGNEEPQFVGLCQYRHFEIVNLLSDGDWKVFNPFLEECGSWITKLTLNRISFNKLDDLKKVMSCSFTPSVQYLKLTSVGFGWKLITEEEDDNASDLSSAAASSNSRFQNSENRVKSLDISFSSDWVTVYIACKRVKIPWTELLQWYPGLQHLRVAELCDRFWTVEAATLFNAITNLRRSNPNNLRLTSIDLAEIDANYSEDDRPATLLHSFFNDINNEFHLETFGLHVTTNAMLTGFHRVLVQQSKSLKRLLMRINENISLENFQIPENNILESITLFGETFPNLSFLKQCPNLKSLAFKRGIVSDYHSRTITIISKSSDEVMNGVVLGSLREFCYEHDQNYDVQDLSRLNRWMPHLKSLQIGQLSAESLRMVFKLWPALEELKFGHGDDVEDEVITGIPRGCQTRLYPNITDLKELRCLQLTPVLQKINPSFTDRALLSGFLQLPKLTSLKFSTIYYIPKSTLDLMKKKIPDSNMKSHWTIIL